MSDAPLISIVIPTRATRGLTLECLRSTFGHAGDPPDALGPSLEVIVVDDGSRDSTAEAVPEEFPCVQVLHRESRGYSAAANAGLRIPQGLILPLLNSDTILLRLIARRTWTLVVPLRKPQD